MSELENIQHRGPCIRCDRKTGHSSGICERCRTGKCKKCEREFIWARTPDVYCGNCRFNRSRKKT